MNYTDYNDFELMYLVSESSEDALNIIFLKYEPLIKKVVSYYINVLNNIKLDYEELVQEGRIGLFNAIKGYKVEKDFLFYTFALLCIKRQVINTIETSKTKKNISLATSLSLDKEEYINNIKGDYMEPLVIFEEKVLEENIIEFKNNLNDLDSLIFELKYNSFSYREISEILDIKLKTVDNRLVKIKKNLRQFLIELQ